MNRETHSKQFCHEINVLPQEETSHNRQVGISKTHGVFYHSLASLRLGLSNLLSYFFFFLNFNLLSHTHLDNFLVAGQCADPIHPDLVRPTLLRYLFNRISSFTNFLPEHAARRLHQRQLKGWGSDDSIFKNLITQVNPRTIIKIGTFLGSSAIHMAELTRLQTQILCVYDFCGWAGLRNHFNDLQMINGDVMLYYQFLQHVVSFNAMEMILLVPFSSWSAIIKMCEIGVYGDLVEIDMGHDFYSVWADINRGFQILRLDGGLFGHDYFLEMDNGGVRRTVDLFAGCSDSWEKS